MQNMERLRGVMNVVLTAASLSIATTAGANEFNKAGLLIEQPQAMATAPGQPHGAVFIKSITNKSAKADQLIGGRSLVSGSVEVHRMEMEHNLMKMREVSGIDLPANAKVMMGRGNKEGYHLMLINLKSPLKAGERFPLTLVFKNAGEIEVTVAVEKPSMPAHGGHKH